MPKIMAGIGPKYRDSVLVDWSYYKEPITQTPDMLRGHGRRHGEALPQVQKEVVRRMIEAGVEKGYTNRQIAKVLATARHESGFNPDAAAGTTSAHGLGQFVGDTAGDNGITFEKRWEADDQVEGLFTFADKNWKSIEKEADRKQIPDSEIAAYRDVMFYKIHHDGNLYEQGKWAKQKGKGISRESIVPRLDEFEALVEGYKEHGNLNFHPEFKDVQDWNDYVKAITRDNVSHSPEKNYSKLAGADRTTNATLPDSVSTGDGLQVPQAPAGNEQGQGAPATPVAPELESAPPQPQGGSESTPGPVPQSSPTTIASSPLSDEQTAKVMLAFNESFDAHKASGGAGGARAVDEIFGNMTRIAGRARTRQTMEIRLDEPQGVPSPMPYRPDPDVQDGTILY